MHAHDHQLPDWTTVGRRETLAAASALADRVRTSDTVPEPDRSLILRSIEIWQLEEHSQHFVHRNPALWTGEAIFGAVSLMLRPFAPAAERVEPLLARLRAMPSFLATMHNMLTRPMPAQWVARARRECTAAVGLFTHGITQWAHAELPDHPALGDLLVAAETVAKEFHLVDAVLGLADVTAESPRLGAESLEALLSAGHGCQVSLADLRAEAHAAIVAARTAFDEALARDGTTWPATQEALAADHPSRAEYLRTFGTRWQACHALAAAHDVVDWPDWPVDYAPIPDWARQAAPSLYWLFYRSPAPDDPVTRFTYQVTPIDDRLLADDVEARLRAWNHSTILLNHVVHHGGIGHHVQNAHAYRQTRSRIGRIAAVDCASRIGLFIGGSMAEGWACYATQLVEELGMLTGAERIAECHTRLRLTARAVVDLELHGGSFTMADAVRCYVTQVGMSPEMAEAEATKNSMFPGTAMMYWFGTSRLLALRERIRTREGSTFTMRAFHDRVLQWGSIPVADVARLLGEEVAA
jgi:hypothetical protein